MGFSPCGRPEDCSNLRYKSHGKTGITSYEYLDGKAVILIWYRKEKRVTVHNVQPHDSAWNSCRSRRRERVGLTLIEVLILGSIVACMLAGANVFREQVGGRFATLLGGVIGFAVVPVLGAMWCSLRSLVIDGIPHLPRCRSNRCRGRDYELRRFGQEFYWVCRCGDRYDRTGRRFMLVTEDDRKVPYKVWRPFRGWFREDSAES